jgi:FkbM family methyltransferase
MNYSHPLLRYPRYLARKSGILGLFERTSIRMFSSAGYEEKLSRLMLSQIRPGDIVWDVGANHGYYTTKFADAVGKSGMVVAFEPHPMAFESLTTSLGSRTNVRLENAALGDFEGAADLFVSQADDGQDYKIYHLAAAENKKPLNSIPQVRVRTGDAFRSTQPQLAPNHIKIDVEAFEYEVLMGLSETLKTEQLRCIYMEVHFTLLRERGLPDVPAKIADLLKDHRFKVKWVGPCHLSASR